MAADGRDLEALQKEASQHDQQIRRLLQRSHLQRTADVCDDHIADHLPSSATVKQIVGIKRVLLGGWGNPQHHFMRTEAGESSAPRHRELFGIHDGFFLWGSGLNMNISSIPSGAPAGIVSFLASLAGGEVSIIRVKSRAAPMHSTAAAPLPQSPICNHQPARRLKPAPATVPAPSAKEEKKNHNDEQCLGIHDL